MKKIKFLASFLIRTFVWIHGKFPWGSKNRLLNCVVFLISFNIFWKYFLKNGITREYYTRGWKSVIIHRGYSCKWASCWSDQIFHIADIKKMYSHAHNKLFRIVDCQWFNFHNKSITNFHNFSEPYSYIARRFRIVFRNL